MAALRVEDPSQGADLVDPTPVTHFEAQKNCTHDGGGLEL
jgi:hypothetical protein